MRQEGLLVALMVLVGMGTPAHAAIIEPGQAGEHVGELVTVDGFAQNVVCSPLTCLISFEAGFSGLVAAIPGTELDRFPPPKESYSQRRLRVQGQIVERDGRLRMEIRDPARIEVVDDAKTASSSTSVPAPVSAPAAPAPGSALAPGSAPAPVPARTVAAATGGSRVLQSMTTTVPPGAGPSVQTQVAGPPPDRTARLRQVIQSLNDEAAGRSVGASDANHAAQQQVIQGLESELQTLQERVVELEQSAQGVSGSGAAEVPRIEPYVVPARNQLHPVKVRTGWSADRVVRALGQPVRADALPFGGSIWFYDRGRSLTFDENGRVVSSSGF